MKSGDKVGQQRVNGDEMVLNFDLLEGYRDDA